MKVICAGLPKTGTKTMAEALRILGYNVHDIFHQFMLDKGLWKKVLNNTASAEDYRKTFSDVDAVTDIPACGVWEQISEVFPEAKVILMERTTEDEWFKSIEQHFEYMNAYIPEYRGGLIYYIKEIFWSKIVQEFLQFNAAFQPGCIGCTQLFGKPVEPILRSRYRQHNNYVKATCSRDKLLVYNVKEGWEPLCKFLGAEVPDVPFPMKNVKAGIVKKIMKGKYQYDCGYYKVARRQVKAKLFMISILFLIFSCFSINLVLGF